MFKNIIMNLINILKERLRILRIILKKQEELENTETEGGKKILEFSIKNFGNSFVSDVDFDGDVDNFDKEFGCAITINNIINEIFGKPIGGGGSTYLTLKNLEKSKRFFEVSLSNIKPGDIIVYATGYGKKGTHGHIFIYIGDYKYNFSNVYSAAASNNSSNGIFDINYTLDSLIDKYQNKFGYPTRIFRKV
jgi:hypothetical protein